MLMQLYPLPSPLRTPMVLYSNQRLLKKHETRPWLFRAFFSFTFASKQLQVGSADCVTVVIAFPVQDKYTHVGKMLASVTVTILILQKWMKHFIRNGTGSLKMTHVTN